MTFSADWLRMRERYDHAARSTALAAAFPVGPGAELLEIACGLGSGARWLAPRLPRARWTLVDHDAGLLAQLPTEMKEFPGEWSARTADIRELASLPAADGVALQALLDLVSWPWLVDFADWLALRRVPLLAGLSVDGRVSWSEPSPLDDEVQAAFRLHQLGDRGFGSSPGPVAAPVLADLLRVRGFRVRLEAADWVIGPDDPVMLAEMVQGTAHAAGEVHPRPERVAEWREERLRAIDRGALSLQVGHWDLLAVP